MSYSQTVNIACTIDNDYVQHCAVMLASLFCNNPESSFEVFIITDGLEHKRRQKLTNFLEGHGHPFSILTVDKTVFKDAPVPEHFSIANYFRILLPQLVGDHIEKILFLDSDMVICRSIMPLWATNISQYSHAAIENPRTSADYKLNLGLSENSFYFNSGVLLINLPRWKELQVTQRTIEFINQYPNKIIYVDQDALNYILEGQWFRVPSEWNAHKDFFSSFTSEALGVTSEEYQQTRNKPAIVHFTGGGSCKPWHYGCVHPLKDEYYKYLKQTPWRDTPPIGKPNLFDYLKEKIKNLRSGYRRLKKA